MKKESNLQRLMHYAGGHRFFTYASWILAAGSALVALVPFWYIWKIIKEILDTSPDFFAGDRACAFRCDGDGFRDRIVSDLHLRPRCIPIWRHFVSRPICGWR